VGRDPRRSPLTIDDVARVRRLTAVCLLGAVGLALTGCSGDAVAPVTGPGGTVVEMDEGFAAETLAQWAEHGDHLVSFTVVRAVRVAPDDEEHSADEGIIGRNVVVTASAPFRSPAGDEDWRVISWPGSASKDVV